MASSQSVEILTDPHRVGRYFDTYAYRITAYIDGIEYFRRVKSHAEYLLRLEHHVALYRRRSHDPVYAPVKQVVHHQLMLLDGLFVWLDQLGSREFKRAISSGHLTFYTNDQSILQQLHDLCRIHDVKTAAYQVVTPANYERGVIYQRQPKHAHRIFLTSRTWEPQETTALGEFLDANSDNFFPSPSLRAWYYRGRHLVNRHRYSYTTLFFDVDDEQYLVYFALKFSNTVGKVCRIEKR